MAKTQAALALNQPADCCLAAAAPPARTLEHSKTGFSNRWENPDTGHKYAVTPIRTYESNSGPCREYTMDAWVGGSREEVHGTACRQPDGSWKIVR